VVWLKYCEILVEIIFLVLLCMLKKMKSKGYPLFNNKFMLSVKFF